jgi:light-regulated signal transduction histidine kinase (bacteriophytochrome)
VAQLCDEAATQVRHLTGYDRVMIYRFNAEGHGTVVAEAKAEHLMPYLHLRYPASDIPQQARRVYALQRVQVVPDRDYTPVPLLSADPEPLDLTYSSLRGLSSVHREYMRNMGVRAGLSISLLRDGALRPAASC